MSTVKDDALAIIWAAIKAVSPEEAVLSALKEKKFSGRVYVAAIGKAAYSMAAAAKKTIGHIDGGVIVTKYGHSGKDLDSFTIIEAGHPLPDGNSIKGAQAVLDMTDNLFAADNVIFLVSGGGSALFEKPEEGITLEDLEDVTRQMLSCGADIVEINTVRKRLSAVKGGKFARHCSPAKVFSVVLSDVLGDRLDTIASGPAYPDESTIEEALYAVKKYGLNFKPHIIDKLKTDTPKTLNNVETVITGSVKALCREAAKAAYNLGYKPVILCSSLSCEAREAGKFLGSIAQEIQENGSFKKPCAIIAGGETVVTLKGSGKGGRNQEFALAAAEIIAGYEDTVIFSVGSDGTDGPTDAAGGIVDGSTKDMLLKNGVKIADVLARNDSYNALKQCGGLVITGPTGTNVNDFAVLLCR